jgi:hypothetical protein
MNLRGLFMECFQVSSGRPNVDAISPLCKFPRNLVGIITDAAKLGRVFPGDNMPLHAILLRANASRKCDAG